MPLPDAVEPATSAGSLNDLAFRAESPEAPLLVGADPSMIVTAWAAGPATYIALVTTDTPSKVSVPWASRTVPPPGPLPLPSFSEPADVAGSTASGNGMMM